MNEFLNNIYNKKLKYNCYVEMMKPKNAGDLFLVYLGTSDFIIISNYWGCIAGGERHFDYEKQEIKIKYKRYNDHLSNSYIIHLLNKHENALACKNLKRIITEMEAEGEGGSI